MAYSEPIHAAVLTYSCFAEGHVGMKIEKNQIAKDGKNRPLNFDDFWYLRNMLLQDKVIPVGSDTNYKLFGNDLPGSNGGEPTAYVLVLKDGMTSFGVDKDKLLYQIQNIPIADKQMLNTRQKKVMNKHKRHNFNIGDKIISADIANGQSTLYNFNCSFLSEAKKLRDAFTNLVEKYDHPSRKLGTLNNLLAEANVYYKDEYKKNNFCGIGYHGDTERPRSPVIGCNVGADRYLSFRAFHKNRYFNDHEVRIKLEHGDIYFMSEHAVGCNWKKSSQVVFRHRAGSLKFLEKDDKDRARRWELAEKKANRSLERLDMVKEHRAAQKRKKDEVEVIDYTEEVVRGGKKYKKVVTYVPMVDLTED